MKTRPFLTFPLLILWTAIAMAQQPANPQPGCSATPEQLAANRKVVLAFFTSPPAERIALADPTYIQHNPAFKKRAEQAHISDYEEFQRTFTARGRGGRGAAPNGPRPPRGNPLEIVTAECDLVTVVHKVYRPDPATPGSFYEAFTFDTFRVKNGKLVEHWDGASIDEPAGH